MRSLMFLLIPTFTVRSILDIHVSDIIKLNVKALFIDVDNTLAGHNSQEPIAGVIQWIKNMKNSGIEVVVVSNNLKKRVGLFSEKLELQFVSFAGKPFPSAFVRAKRVLKNKNIEKKHCLAIGDQIFTDVLGANLYGIKCVLVEPIIQETSLSFRIKRKLEYKIKKLFVFKQKL